MGSGWVFGVGVGWEVGQVGCRAQEGPGLALGMLSRVHCAKVQQAFTA
jgi:hypothetical protein